MKTSGPGFVRNLDKLGRIVLPAELRKRFGINDGDPLEFFITGNGELVMKRYSPGCIFCNDIPDYKEVYHLNGKIVCEKCASEAIKNFEKA